MASGMSIRRRITATNVPAFQAKPQMNPRGSHSETFNTALSLSFGAKMDIVKMLAMRIGHIVSPESFKWLDYGEHWTAKTIVPIIPAFSPKDAGTI